jgi:hypothetical protein
VPTSTSRLLRCVVAGFQVSISGRIWVSTEVRVGFSGRSMAGGVGNRRGVEREADGLPEGGSSTSGNPMAEDEISL